MSVQGELFGKAKKPSKVPPQVEEIVAGGFDVRKFVENFEVLAEAAGGVARLRELIYDLGVNGLLVPHSTGSDACQLASRMAEQSGYPLDDTAPPFELPRNWVWSRLGAVASEVRYGYTASARPEREGVRLLRITDIQNDRVDWATVPGCDIDDDKLPTYKLHDGDLVIARTGGTIGKTYVVDQIKVRAVFASYLIRVAPLKPMLPAYLKAFSGSGLYWRQLRAGSAGTGQPNVSATTLKALFVPVPPPEEQKRIVETTDELMALCDDLEARQAKKRETGARLTKSALEALTTAEGPEEFEVAWKRVVENFEVVLSSSIHVEDIRRAIRGAACGGWLSSSSRRPDWGTGEEALVAIATDRKCDTRHLLQRGIRPSSLPSEKRRAFPTGQLHVPRSWSICGIDDILACIPNALKAGPFGSALTKSMYVPSGFKVYGQEQVIPGDHRIGSYYIDSAKFESLRTCAVVPGDMLVSLMGTVGRVLVLPPDAEPGIINPRLLKITLSKRVSSEYIRLYLQSPQARDFFEGAARGVAMDGLNVGILRSLPIALPPISEQNWLVAKVEQLMTTCDELEAKFRRREDRAARLVESVVRELVA